jgi:competence protein ComEC
VTNTHLLRLAAGLVVILAVLAFLQLSRTADGHVHLSFFDVGQGDAALVVTPSGKQIVVDGGPDGSLLPQLARSMPFFDRSIDLLVLSHPHMDHIASFPEILRRYQVSSVLMTGVAYKMGKYEEFLELLTREGATVVLADPARDIDMGDGVRLDVLWPPPGLLGKTAKELNDTSVAFKLTWNGKTALFTGDMEAAAEKALLASKQDLHADILKVGHHGSETSSGTGLLLAVAPKLAVISCGRNNKYGHPDPEVLERLRHFGIPYRITAREGTVAMTW